MKPYIVTAIWDDEGGVWWAESEDIPGLATEADTVEALLIKLKAMIPELAEANWPGMVDEDIEFTLRAFRDGVAAVPL